MTNLEILTLCNSILTTAALSLAFFNYKHSRKKDFQDKLYQLKLDAYKELNAKCYEAYKQLNSNSWPFSEIYNIEIETEWDTFFVKEVSKLYHVGFELQELIYNHSHILPNEVIEAYNEFSNFCLGFVTKSAHYDTHLIVDSTGRLWGIYTELIDIIRNDLHIEKVNKDLFKRMNNPIV
jgi:hypothetical protein